MNALRQGINHFSCWFGRALRAVRTADVVAARSGAVRTLLLLRHAKSSWDDPMLSDHDRPLTDRGARAAVRMATEVTSYTQPTLVLCSSARRALDTLAPLRSMLDGAEIRIEPDLYGAGADWTLRRLRKVDADISTVLVIG